MGEDTLILKNIEWGSNGRVGDSMFFAEFDDHTLIEYIPKGLMYDEKKRTLWIGVNPNEVNIAFFHEDFEEGFNSDNETGCLFRGIQDSMDDSRDSKSVPKAR